jgi:hypothetical protein
MLVGLEMWLLMQHFVHQYNAHQSLPEGQKLGGKMELATTF